MIEKTIFITWNVTTVLCYWNSSDKWEKNIFESTTLLVDSPKFYHTRFYGVFQSWAELGKQSHPTSTEHSRSTGWVEAAKTIRFYQWPVSEEFPTTIWLLLISTSKSSKKLSCPFNTRNNTALCALLIWYYNKNAQLNLLLFFKTSQ